MQTGKVSDGASEESRPDRAPARYADGADFDALWENVRRELDNPAAHKKFINFAVLSQRHLAAAAKYDELDDRELAEKFKRTIAMQVAAQHMIATPAVERDHRRARLGWLLVGTGIGFCFAFLITQSLIGLIGPVAILIGALEIKQSKM